MEYWVVFSFVWIVRLNIHHYFLWPSVLMFIALYLQHGYFQGASRVISVVLSIWYMLLLRNQNIQQLRKDKMINDKIGDDDVDNYNGNDNDNAGGSKDDGDIDGYSMVDAVAEDANKSGGTPTVQGKQGDISTSTSSRRSSNKKSTSTSKSNKK